MWATISTPQRKLLIGVIYRHPNSNLNSFLENFDLTLHKINKNKCQSIIMGDFNVNLLNETPFVTNYKNTIARNAFFSVVNIPTRVTETTKTAIDHILTNITSEEIKPGVLLTDISDHFPTFAYIFQLKISYNMKHEMFRRNLKNFNSLSFADCVSMKLKIYFDNVEHINKNNINKV